MFTRVSKTFGRSARSGPRMPCWWNESSMIDTGGFKGCILRAKDGEFVKDALFGHCITSPVACMKMEIDKNAELIKNSSQWAFLSRAKHVPHRFHPGGLLRANPVGASCEYCLGVLQHVSHIKWKAIKQVFFLIAMIDHVDSQSIFRCFLKVSETCRMFAPSGPRMPCLWTYEMSTNVPGGLRGHP